VKTGTAVFSGQSCVHAPDPAEGLRGEDFGRQAGRLGAPIVHDHDPVGGGRGEGEVMDDDQGAEAVVDQLAQQAGDIDRGTEVELRGRLVAVSQGTGRAIAHLNADHDDALLDMAGALAGCDEATSARCLDADLLGLMLLAATPTGELTVRVPYDEPIDDAEDLRKATVKLAHRAREILDER
jgi:hypothetical protein